MPGTGWGLAIVVAFGLSACGSSCGPSGATRTPPRCNPDRCAEGEVRCQNGCVRLLAMGDRCSPQLDCSQPMCGEGLVCHEFLGGTHICLEGKPVLKPCFPGGDECAYGLYCEPTRDLRPVKPGDPPGFCVPWLAERARCALANGDRLTCEPGLACVAGVCRRPCQSVAECPCGSGDRCMGAGEVSPGEQVAGTFCIGCVDLGEPENAFCSAADPCCRKGLVCGTANVAPQGPAACCAPTGVACLDCTNCCAPDECVGNQCCAPLGAACGAGPCCEGACCGGTCKSCDREQGLTLDPETCQCVPRTCAVDRTCPFGGRPDPYTCTCQCVNATGGFDVCCPFFTRDCGVDSFPRCVDFSAPCPSYCWREDTLRSRCGEGQTCCGGSCHPWPFEVCCRDDGACREGQIRCPANWCCHVGTTCCGYHKCC